MKSFIRFFAARNTLAFVITLAIILSGVSTLMTIKRDALPNANLEEMDIVTIYPGGSAEDVEINVTTKIEEELKEVDGLESVQSVSMENQSNIHVKIDRGARDTEKVKRDVRNAVDRVVDLPKEVTDSSTIIEISTDLIPVIELSVASDQLEYNELRNIAKDLKQKLLDLPEVSSVREHGLLEREVQIKINAKKAERLQVSSLDVLNAIRAHNIRASAGVLESYDNEKSIVTISQFKNPDDVANVIVRSSFEGPAVYVKDVADIVVGFEDETKRVRVNGSPAITFEVLKKASADIIDTSAAVTALAEMEKQKYQDKVNIQTTGDASKVVKNRISVVLSNGLMGLIFVLILLVMMLNLKVAFWTALGIPIALLGAIFFLPMFDMTLNAIAMGGLIIVIGIVVDDAIVISENITRHSEMGKNAIDAAVDGTEEVIKPVLATVLTTILAFCPMFFIDGVLGDFVFVIPLVVCLALTISLLESIFAMPAHLAAGLKNNNHAFSSPKNEPGKYFVSYVQTPVVKLASVALKNRYGVIFLFVALLAGSFYYAKNHIDFILFPSDTAEEMDILVELPTGASLDATVDVVKQVEEMLESIPDSELLSYVVRVGRVSRNNVFSSSNNALITVYLTPYSQRERGARVIVKEMEDKASAIKNAHITFQLEAGGPPVGKPITLRVTGNDDVTRNKLVDDIVNKLSTMKGVSGIDADNKKGREQIEVKLDYIKLAELGLTVSSVTQSLRLALDGEVASSVRYQDDDVDFRVQFDKQSIKDLASLEKITITNKQGRMIRLSEIADLQVSPSLSIYSHYQNKRSVLITAELDIDVMTPVEATQSILAQIDMTQWQGMEVISDGEADESQESVGSLGSAFVIAMVGILLVLILLFNSLIKPFIVLSIIPFGLIGVIWIFVAHDLPISFIAAIGVIGLAGVLVNDSIIMVDYVDTVKKSTPDLSYFDAVQEAIKTRLRPILLTSLTTVSGLIPLAYGIGGADPFMAPMAFAMGYGVLFATPLAVFLIPCILLVSDDAKNVFGKLFNRFSRNNG